MEVASTKTRVHFEGEQAHRRAFLQAAAVATGGALIAGGAARAQEHPGGGHQSSAEEPHGGVGAAPPKEAFEGLLVTPGAMAATLERKNIEFLPDAELANLRQAFGLLGSGASPGAIYQSWVGLHAQNCQHNNSVIWPWHRAYLYYFEQRLQRALPAADPPVTLPYWPYDTIGTEPTTREHRKLPAPFRPRNVDGQPNPLYYDRPAGQNTGDYILSFNGTRTSGIIDHSNDFFQFGVNLENGPHNYVHNNPPGAIMNNRLYSPTDPIFWLHHANLDRAWFRWTQIAGHHNPREHESPAIDNWLNYPLPGFYQFPKRLVSEFLEPSALGYTYVMQAISIVASAKDAAQAKPREVDFSAAILPEAARAAAAGAGGPAIRPVLIRFRDVSLPRSSVLEVRVFLNHPGATAETSPDDPRCAGIFTLYPPHGEHGPAPDQISIDLDATEAVRSLLGREQGRTKFPLTTVVVPSKQAAAEAEAEPLRYKSAQVIILDAGEPDR